MDSSFVTGQSSQRRLIRFLAHRLSSAEFPVTLAVADSLPVPLEDEFVFGLELIINGLRRLHDR